MRWLVAMLLCIGAARAADDPRWVTFRTARNDWGLVQHQIDRRSIRTEGSYRTFWTRMWRVEKKEQLVASYYGSLIFWSQKFAVDCAGRRWSRDLLDTNLPSERKRKVSLEKMRWQPLDKNPAVGKAVCGL
jgi:hypothetical protein